MNNSLERLTSEPIQEFEDGAWESEPALTVCDNAGSKVPSRPARSICRTAVVAKPAPAVSGQRSGWPGRRKSFAALRSEATSEEFDSTGDRYGSVGGDSGLEDDAIRPMVDALPPWVLNGTRQIVDLCRRRGVVRYADIFGAGESAIFNHIRANGAPWKDGRKAIEVADHYADILVQAALLCLGDTAQSL